MRFRGVVALLYLQLFLFFSVQPARAEEIREPVENLQTLIDQALSRNPELRASEARWQMFSNRVRQVKAWEDPMLMLKIQNGIVTDPLNFSRDSMTQKVIGITQQIPYFGKRALKGELAAREADSYRWSHGERKLELVRMVKETYYQLFFNDKSREIVEKNIRILDDFIILAETRYAVGQGVQQDIFKAQLERSKMLDMRISLEQQRKSLAANLNALLYRQSDTPVATVPDFSLQPLTAMAEQLKALAEENRPLLNSYRSLIQKGRVGYNLAQKEYYPDFNVSFEYMQRQPAMESDGADMYSLGVTFNLPVRRERRQAMLAEASSEVAMASEELNSARNAIQYGIADLLAQLERRQKLAELYKTAIIPQAAQALESATISYRVNKVDFLTLLDSRVSLFNYEREYYDSLADYQMKLAQLEALVGTEIQ